MPHCTSNFAWYLGKFIAGFTGMFFLYMFFLKEKEYSCLCRARMRELMRRRGENTNSCSSDDQADANAKKECSPNTMLAAAKNVWTWYTTIRELFHVNDPAILSETVPALKRGLPKNDNDMSSVNCMCCMSLLNRKPKLTESATTVRKKQSGRQCLFRHCSGIVSAQKLTRRRRNKQHCVHLRVSHDVISHYWKISNKDGGVMSGDAGANNVKTVQEREAGKANLCCCKRVRIIDPFVKEKQNVENSSQNNVECTKEERSLCPNEGFCKIPSQNVARSNVGEDVCDNGKESLKNVNKDKPEGERKNSSKINKDFCNDKLTDDLDTCKWSSRTMQKSLGDQCIDPISSKKNPISNAQDRINKLTVINKILNNAEEFSTQQSQKYNVKPTTNKYQSTLKVQRSLSSTHSSTWHKKSKFLCPNCTYNIKAQNRINSQWNNAKKEFPLKFNSYASQLKNINSAYDSKVMNYETRATYRSRIEQPIEKPTLVLFKNKRSNRFRFYEDPKCEDSVNSGYSSSSFSTEITESSSYDNRPVHRYPIYKSCYPMTMNGQQKSKRYNARVVRNSVLSSSSSLSSFKRHHSLLVLSEDSMCHNPRQVSSSCMNVRKWNKRYRKNRKGTKTYSSSTSSSSSLASPSTFEGDLELGTNVGPIACNSYRRGDKAFGESTGVYKESLKNQRRYRKPRVQEQRKKMIHGADERRVKWDVY